MADSADPPSSPPPPSVAAPRLAPGVPALPPARPPVAGEAAGSRFAHVPHTPAGHFVLHFYAAVHRVLNQIRRLARHGGDDLDVTFLKYPFLSRYGDEIRRHLPPGTSWDNAPAWWEKEILAWEETTRPPPEDEEPIHLPLAALTAEAGISYRSRLALMIVGLVEEDSRFGTVFADLQAPLGHRRPTLEFVSHAMAGEKSALGGDLSGVCRPLLSAALLEVVNRDVPRSEWALRVPAVLWEAVKGAGGGDPAPWCRLYPPNHFPPPEELVGPDDFLDQIRHLPALLGAGQAKAVIVRGMPGSDRLRVLGSVARGMNRRVIEIPAAPSAPGGKDREPPTAAGGPPETLGPLCCLAGAMPVLRYDLGPGETAAVPNLPAYRGPVGVILGNEGGLSGRAVEKSVTLSPPAPDAGQRLRLWRDALGERAGRTPAADLQTIADRFRLPAGHVREAAGLAVAQAGLRGRDAVTPDDVRQACRALNRQMLDALAARVDGGGTWGDLILTGGAGEKLGELERRCRHRERLLANLGPAFGPAATGNRGVRALFSGPSGTGKTLAARVLAAELGMDLYRVDLAAVINKYIGETEKNLHRVLSVAESLDVVLLLDEGDALLGSRTDVKTSNDRYANLETNYLLQRLETYQGIVVVTTNLGENIDTAFQRRMDVVVNFLPPQARERRRIWDLHLPAGHGAVAAYLDEVAARCALTGGQIRNAAQAAALLALDDGDGPPADRHVAEALAGEYRKAGALSAVGRPARAATRGGWEAFAAALAAGGGAAPVSPAGPGGGAARRTP